MNDLVVSLLSNGYNVWCPIDPEEPTWVVGDSKDLYKCAVRKAFISNGIPTVNINTTVSQIECTHMLVWEPESRSSWLLPVADLPQADHIRLSAKYGEFMLTGTKQLTHKERKELKAAIAAKVQSDIDSLASHTKAGDISFLERGKIDVESNRINGNSGEAGGIPTVAEGDSGKVQQGT